MERVTVYVDGFNLFYGLKEQGWSHFLWLDLQSFGESLAEPGQEVTQVKYFTARIGRPEQSVKRQSTFLDANRRVSPELLVVEGNCIYNDDHCKACGSTWKRREEKKTDVSIALHMLDDSHHQRFDTAVLVSADSDLVPVVEMIEATPGQRVVSRLPPKRHCGDLKRASSSQAKIGEPNFADNQLPLMIQMDGFVLMRPAKWSPEGK